MELFFAAFIAFVLAMVLLSVGAWVQGKCLKGTCGGLNQLRDENGRPICEACAPDAVEKHLRQASPKS